MTDDIAIRILTLIEKFDGLVELLPQAGGKMTLAYNDGDWVVLYDPGRRRHRQTLYRGRDLEEAVSRLSKDCEV